MSNPPPARPWFRLPMSGRQAPPPPLAQAQAQARAPAPQQPRPPFVRPAFSQAFRPIQPQPPAASPPSPTPPPVIAASPPSPTPPPVIAASPPSPTPRPIIAPNPSVSPSPSPPASPSPPNVASSPTPTRTSPKAFGISSPSSTTSSEFTPKQSPNRSPILSSASPRKPQVYEAPSLNSPASTFPPKSSSYPSINSFQSPSPTALPRAIQPLSPAKFIRSPSPVSPQPPSKEEPEPKKVLFEETFNIPASKSTHRVLPSDSEEAARNMRVLTIAGENKGASMELGYDSKYFNGNSNEARESEDLHSGKANWSGHEVMTTKRWPMNAYVNSNVQPINGSILLNCSLTQHDPGVHFSLSKKPIKGNGHGNGLKDHSNTNQV